MSHFTDSHPIVLLLYFLMVALFAMFSKNPVIIILFFLGAVVVLPLQIKGGGIHSLLWVILWCVMALMNPLFYHNGVTVLLVINDNPFTLEALLYGVIAATMLVAAIGWFRSFTCVMTSEKVLYLFGRLSPKLALLISMTLRYVPLFREQTKRVKRARLLMGDCDTDSPLGAIRGGFRTTSVMTTWALEEGIVTADSMEARGYGVSIRRTNYARFHWKGSDTVFGAVLLLCSAVVIASAKANTMQYYPSLGAIPHSALSIAGYIAYGSLVMMPAVWSIMEDMRWQYLQSKI